MNVPPELDKDIQQSLACLSLQQDESSQSQEEQQLPHFHASSSSSSSDLQFSPSQDLSSFLMNPLHQQDAAAVEPPQAAVHGIQAPPPQPPQNKQHKQVRFSYVTIRNYDMTLGDNPAVSIGAPIQLDWVYEEIAPLLVRDFEQFKVQRRRRSSSGNGKQQPSRPKIPIHNMQMQDSGITSTVMPISADFRKGILKRAGFTDWQIEQTERSVKKIQTQRQRTQRSNPFYRVEYAMRSAGRKLQRTMGSSASGSSPNMASQSSSLYVHHGFGSGGDWGGYQQPAVVNKTNFNGKYWQQQQDDATTAQLTDESSIYGGDYNYNQPHSHGLSANAQSFQPRGNNYRW